MDFATKAMFLLPFLMKANEGGADVAVSEGITSWRCIGTLLFLLFLPVIVVVIGCLLTDQSQFKSDG